MMGGSPQQRYLGCIEPGEIIDAPVGHVLAQDGEQTGFFHIMLEGEARITRTYDRQSILMAMVKPGGYFGEIMLLLGIPWMSSVRVSKAARLFRLNEENFWQMLVTCQCVAREIFRSASNRMASGRFPILFRPKWTRCIVKNWFRSAPWLRVWPMN